MRRIENDCCDCATDAYPCLGKSCPLRHVPHYYCDKCGEELDSDDMYLVDGEDLCEYCLKDMFRIDPSDEDYDTEEYYD